MPAYFNGIFGHKPSKFIVSNHGQYPNTTCEEQNSFLCEIFFLLNLRNDSQCVLYLIAIGPMCRFAKDLKPMMKIIAAANGQFLDLDEPVNLTKLKYFYQESDGGAFLVSPVDTDIKDAIQKVAAHFKRTLKAETVKKVQIDKLRKSIPIWLSNMKTKDAISFDRQLTNLEGKISPWIELFKWFFRQSNHTFIAILTAFTDNAGAQVDSPTHQFMVEQKKELLEEFKQMLGSDGVFIYPVHPTVAPYHHEPIIRALNFGYTGIFNILGLPATSVPLGLGREGLPIGLQVVANVNQDRYVIHYT